MVLVVGNFLNQGTPRGQALGFKLETLTKLQDTRATDQRTTLLKYIAGICKQKLGMDVGLEFKYVEDVSKLMQSEVSSDVLSLQNTLQSLKKEIEFFKENDTEKWNQLHAFYERANERVTRLVESHSRAIDEFRQLLTYFGENPSQTSLEDFFGTICQFSVSYNRCLKEIEEEEERTRRLQESEKKKQYVRNQVVEKPSKTEERLLAKKQDLDGNEEKEGNRDGNVPVVQRNLFLEMKQASPSESESPNSSIEPRQSSFTLQDNSTRIVDKKEEEQVAATVLQETSDDKDSVVGMERNEELPKEPVPVLSRVSSGAIPPVSKLSLSDENKANEMSSEKETRRQYNGKSSLWKSSNSSLFPNARKNDAVYDPKGKESLVVKDGKRKGRMPFPWSKRH